LFDKLASEQRSLESKFGEELSWERLDECRACRVAVYRPGSIEDDQQTLEVVRGWMIERILKFKDVFGWRLA
jgi:hypothetical protein